MSQGKSGETSLSLQTEPASAAKWDRRANPLLAIDAIRPTAKTARELLQIRGIEVTSETKALSRTEKLTLTANLDQSFEATPLEQAIYGDLHDAVRATWAKVNPLSPAAIERTSGFGDAIRTANPKHVPTAKIRGQGFVLCCAAESGGLRFVERTTELLGQSLRFLSLDVDTDVPYWPAMVVRWPACGTDEQFHANFLAAFDANASGSRFFSTAFRSTAKKVMRPIYVSALAAMANVGLLFVVGANYSNFHSEKSRKLLLFLDEFMAQTGISVVFVCTAPVYERLLQMGTVGASLTSGSWEEIQWLVPESAFFREVNHSLWKQSLVWDEPDDIPEDVLAAAAEVTHGSRDALCRFHRMLQIAAIRDTKRQKPVDLLNGVVREFRRQTEQLQRVGQFLRDFYERAGKKDTPVRATPAGNVWADFLSVDTCRALGYLAQ